MYKRILHKVASKAFCLQLVIGLLLSISINSLASSGTVYESENNNSYLNADVTYNDYDSYGLMNSPNDIDYWVVSFPYGGTANFYLGNIPSGKNYNMYIYSANGTTLLRSSTNSGNAFELVSMSVSANQNYYIKIASASGSSTTSYYLFRSKVYSSRTLQVPRYVQGSPSTCGPACGRMILSYYGINVDEQTYIDKAEEYCDENEDYTYVYINTKTINYYLSVNGNSTVFHYKYTGGMSDQQYADLMLSNILNGYPVQMPLEFYSTTYFPYTTGGHYMVLKGMQYNTTSVAYNAVMNDPHYTYSDVYTVPISVIQSYNLDHSGFIICVND